MQFAERLSAVLKSYARKVGSSFIRTNDFLSKPYDRMCVNLSHYLFARFGLMIIKKFQKIQKKASDPMVDRGKVDLSYLLDQGLVVAPSSVLYSHMELNNLITTQKDLPRYTLSNFTE